MFKKLALVATLLGVSGIVFAYKLGNTTYTYTINKEKITDQIIISTPGYKKQILPGPISNLSVEVKNRIKKCFSEVPEETKKKTAEWRNLCIGWYEILKVSPRGRYIELRGSGYESMSYEIYGIKEKKTVYKHSGMWKESRWTPNKQQLIFISEYGMWTEDETGVFISKNGEFPAFEFVLPEVEMINGVAKITAYTIKSLTDKQLVIKAVNEDQTVKYITIDINTRKVIKTTN